MTTDTGSRVIEPANDAQESDTDNTLQRCAQSMGLAASSSPTLPLAVPRNTPQRAISGSLFFTSRVAASPPPSTPTIHQQTFYTPSQADTSVNDDDSWRTQRRSGRRRAEEKYEPNFQVQETPILSRKLKRKERKGNEPARADASTSLDPSLSQSPVEPSTLWGRLSAWAWM